MNPRSFLFLVLAVCIAAPLSADNTIEKIPDAIHRYVAKPEAKYGWTLARTVQTEAGTVYEIDLTSQEWQGIVWKHVLQVFEPKQLTHPNHMLLFVGGGSNGKRPGADSYAMGLKLSELTGACAAVLNQVPNQPLFDGRKEDDLITETWLKYLETGDDSWPLLFPMVKSAVKAMDALNEFAEKQYSRKIQGYVITGGSKRGWTSWLTPVADKRIVATAPLVIDVLNFRAQMKHQLDSWGKYSEQIADYSSKGLIKPGDETPREAMLRQMMDPYTYRSQLQLPKLIVNGANDRYWTVDATRFYWDDLVGQKYLLAIPNAGHGLDSGRELALSTVGVFFRHAVTRSRLPDLTWRHLNGEEGFVLEVSSSKEPHGVRLWVVNSEDKDFRDDKWTSRPLSVEQARYVGKVSKPEKGHVALFGEVQFMFEGIPYSLCTLTRAE